MINNHLARARGGKVSFTHLIGWAIVQALEADAGDERRLRRGRRQADARRRPAHVNLGLAIDLTKPDGTRQLLVPNIKQRRHDGLRPVLVRPTRTSSARPAPNKLTVDDFAGTTISLTNPGTIGTVHSVPRLMAGQGTIVGVGAMEYPAEYQGAVPGDARPRSRSARS